MRALIIGVLGQDGSYLAEYLRERGYEIYGTTSRLRNVGEPFDHVPAGHIRFADIRHPLQIEALIQDVRPDQVYNLGAVTTPNSPWGSQRAVGTAAITGLGPINVLEAVLKYAPEAHIVHASSSAIFDSHHKWQDEETPINPPKAYGLYGAAKALAHRAVIGYREGFNLRASNAILFSHTSPRQDTRFLARQITRIVALAAVKPGVKLTLTDPDNRRDWGFAPDYARAMALVGAYSVADDYVVSTTICHTVRYFTEVALDEVSLRWDDVVDVIDDGERYAINEVSGNNRRICERFGWRPTLQFEDVVRTLVRHDTRVLRGEIK